MIWIVAIAMAGVGGYWVKVRRQRKAKSATPYVGS
jgi:hypothetical protein